MSPHIHVLEVACMLNKGPQTFYVTSTIHATVPIQRPMRPDGTPERTRITVQTPLQIPVYPSGTPQDTRFNSIFEAALSRFEDMLKSSETPDIDKLMDGARRFADLIQAMATEASASAEANAKSIVIE